MGYVGQAPAAAGVTSTDILDGTVASADLGDNQVTLAKVADIARGSLIVGNASAATAELTKGSASTVLTSDGTDIAWAAAAAGGITEADMWRLSDHVAGNFTVSANLERVDTGGFGLLSTETGTSTGMTQSSGVFSFPDTGYWLIEFTAHVIDNSAADTNMTIQIETTTNNSTYVDASFGKGHFPSNGELSVSASFLFDVTNISTHKVLFKVSAMDGSNLVVGDTAVNSTYMTFIRLGST
jgi:hypothetical protein